MVRAARGWGVVLLVAGILAAVAAVAAYPVWSARQPGLVVAAAGVGAVLGGFAPGLVSGLLEWSRRRRRRVEVVSDLQVAELRSVAGLLNPVAEVVAFAGRVAQLAALRVWCEDGKAAVVRLVAAPGGFGKTRLAAEFAGRMRARRWECWQVAAGREDDAAQQIRDGGSGRLLVVLDYAEARRGAELARLLVAAYRAAGRVRVLLLARTAGSWWRYLSVGSADQAALIDAMTVPANVIELPARADDRSPVAVMAAAAVDFARRLDVTAPRVLPPPPTGELSLLRMHARALTAVLGDPADSGHDVLDDVLRHEARYWRGRAQRAGLLLPADADRADQLMRQVVAVAVLFGADTPEEVDDLVRRVPALDGVGDETAAGWSRWLRDLYPDPGANSGRLGVLQPDLLAETLAIEVLTNCTPAQRHGLWRGLTQAQAVQVLTVLGRATAHHPVGGLIQEALTADLATMTAAVIATARQFPGTFVDPAVATLDAAAGHDGLVLDQCKLLYAQIPDQSLELYPLALTLANMIVSGFGSGEGPSDRADRAQWLTEQGRQLAHAGRWTEGLQATEKAVELYRGLVEADRDAYLPNLAKAVNHLAIHLTEAGRSAEGLAAAEEAVELRRELVQVDREAYLPGLAGDLNNLAIHLSEAGQSAEALRAAQEAAELRLELAEFNRDAHLPALAASLNNLAVRLVEAGRRAEGLAACQEALQLRRELVEVDPDAYLPDLARSIYTLAVYWGEAGQEAQALATAEESVQLERNLVERNRSAYLPGLALSMENLVTRLIEAGRQADGLAAAQETVELYRELASRNPKLFDEALIRSEDTLEELRSPTRRTLPGQ